MYLGNFCHKFHKYYHHHHHDYHFNHHHYHLYFITWINLLLISRLFPESFWMSIFFLLKRIKLRVIWVGPQGVKNEVKLIFISVCYVCLFLRLLLIGLSRWQSPLAGPPMASYRRLLAIIPDKSWLLRERKFWILSSFYFGFWDEWHTIFVT